MPAPDDALIQDPDELVARRERRALRWARVAAVSGGAVGIVGWVLGPCWAAMVWPWVASGGALLAPFAAAIGLGAAGVWVLSARIARQGRGDRHALGRSCGQMALATLPMSVLALCWWPFLIWFIASGNSFWGEEWRAAIGTVIVSLPAVPCGAATWAWWRYRRVYPTITPGDGPMIGAWWRSPVLAGFAVLLLVACLWPGGPRRVGATRIIDGQSIDDWVVRWASWDDNHLSEVALAKAGDDAVEAMAAQWPVPADLRATLAQWLGTNFEMAGYIARAFRRIRIGVTTPQELVQSIQRMGPAVGGLAPQILHWNTDRSEVPFDQFLACLAGMGPRALGPLLDCVQDDRSRLAALQALARLEPDPAHPADPAALTRLAALAQDVGLQPHRFGATQALGRLGGPAEVADALAVLGPALTLDDAESVHATVAAGWIGAAAGPLAPQLRQLFDAAIAQPGQQLPARVALLALALVGDDPGALGDRIVVAAASADPQTRAAAALAAGAMEAPPANVRAILVTLLSDPVWDVGLAAFTGLAHATGDASPALPFVQASLTPNNVTQLFGIVDRLIALGPVAAGVAPALDAPSLQSLPGLRYRLDDARDCLKGAEPRSIIGGERLRTREELRAWIRERALGR